jgi:phosphatidate cytidylyltransferase
MKRILTAFILVPVTVYTVLFAPDFLFLTVVALMALLCFREYATMTRSFAPLGFVAGLLILLARPEQTTPILILTALAALCLPLAAPSLDKAVASSGALFLGVAYIFGAWKTAMLLHDIETPPLAHLTAGRHWLMFGLAVNWFGDTGAYYVGRRFGKRKLAPAVSPGKTWEGTIASLVTGVVFGLIYLPLTITGMSLWKAGAIALVANIAGQVGDLAESAMKRSAGVKDSGTLLPGHGGMLDRVDSTLFTLPVLYVMVGLLHV